MFLIRYGERRSFLTEIFEARRGGGLREGVDLKSDHPVKVATNGADRFHEDFRRTGPRTHPWQLIFGWPALEVLVSRTRMWWSAGHSGAE